MKSLFFFISTFIYLSSFGQVEHVFQKNQSFTHNQAIAAYERLAATYPAAQLEIAGTTDSGKPLHVFVIDQDKTFSPAKTRENNKRVLMVNNGIHAGEPCGIDGSIWWAEDLLKSKSPLLQNTVVVIIPIYSVGGSLNRGCCSRTNQNGPEQHGFRGNAKNLDLNRDFIKCDSRNAQAFTTVFHHWNPDVFVDTHTTNGADYQHTMTVIAPNKDKMDPLLGSITEKDLTPYLYQQMDSAGFPMAPYVSTFGKSPDTGIAHFPDSPRYSSGFVNLFHTIGFTSEAHMLKPFEDRVWATISFLDALLKMTDKYGDLIVKLRDKAAESTINQTEFELNHRIDSTRHEVFPFLGYEAETRTSPVTGLEQVYYNNTKPYRKAVPYYNRLKATHSAQLPAYYIIPQAWVEVIDRLSWNNVTLERLTEDMALPVEILYIAEYETTEKPYEGHYLHRDVSVKKTSDTLQFYVGDFVVATNQKANQYLAHVLDPVSEDSFFNWNFFDEVLMQKEWFSPYIFDQEAAEILENDDVMRARFLTKKKDPDFAASVWAQLYWIFQQTEHYEKTHNRYPIAGYNGVFNSRDLRPTTP